ncbi:MAG: response regulator [Phototrophicaceae bacterium]|jgi:CheY-like chemotaxis protein
MTERASILIVDDTPANLKLLIATLEEVGYETLPLTDPRQALEVALRQQPDLVLTDISMPYMNGLELCAQFHTHPMLQHIPMILVSAQGEPIDAARAAHVGAVDYMNKPLDLDMLLYKVQQVLKSKVR